MMENYHNFFNFFISTAANSIIYTWIYNSTKGNLLSVSLFHATTNAVNYLLFISNDISHEVFYFYLTVEIVFAFCLLVCFKSTQLAPREKMTFSLIKKYFDEYEKARKNKK